MALLAVTLLGLSTYSWALWPGPSTFDSSSTVVNLDSDFKILPPKACNVPDDLARAMEAALAQINQDNMKPLQPDLVDLEKRVMSSPLVPLSTLQLSLASELPEADFAMGYRHKQLYTGYTQIKSIAEEVNRPVDERDERYSLQVVPGDSTAYICAFTSLGLLRGLQTITQLVYTAPKAGRYGIRYIMNAPVHIVDEPAFKMRGFLLDTARNFYPVDVLKRTLHAASWSKMNLFHWHIVDSQSWPLVLKSYPELASSGAYSHEQIYSPSDLEQVISFANSIGIEVIVELDTPGHTATVASSHPEMVSCAGSDWTTNAVEPPAGQLRPTSEEAIEMISGVYEEVLSRLPGRHFGTGGDEVNQQCYASDKILQTDLLETNRTIIEALADFTHRTHSTVFRAGKTPVVWEDSAVGIEAVPLDPRVIVTAWRGSTSLPAILEKGYRILQASFEYFYLDCGIGGWVGAGEHWCRFNSWWQIYSFQHFKDFSEDQKHLLLGGEVLLWSEQADPNTVDSDLWPRAAAASELWWLGPKGSNGKGLDSKEALARLHDFRYRMVARGISARPLQPHWCALRPGECLL